MSEVRRHPEESSGITVDREVAATLQPVGIRDLAEGERNQIEIDAGVVLFGIVIMLLMGIPVSMAMLRFRVGRRNLRSGGIGRIPTEDAQRDPWKTAAHRVEVDPDDEETFE